MAAFCRLRRSLGFLLLASTIVLISPASAQRTYYIDETTDFSGNGCPNADLNDVTSSLRNCLNSLGWSGQRWTNSNAWPQDYYDSTLPGLSGVDNLYGDNALFTVYAGHGNRALLQFGYKRLNMCTVNLETQARLGTLGGGGAVYAMYVTSCTLNLDALSRNFNHQVRQQFGYHNSPAVGGDQPRDFFEDTDDNSNVRAWIDEMEDRDGWFTGDNSPIALTFGVDANHCAWVRDTARLRAGDLIWPPPKPWGYYWWIMYDHGDGGC